MQLALYFTSFAAATAIASALVLPKGKNTAKFMVTGKKDSNHYEAQEWFEPITGTPDPQWDASWPTGQAGNPEVAQRLGTGRVESLLAHEQEVRVDSYGKENAGHDLSCNDEQKSCLNKAKRHAIPEADARWCGRPGEPCWVKVKRDMAI